MKLKRILSLLIVLAMVLSTMGTVAFADVVDTITSTKYYNDETVDLNGGTLVVKAKIVANSGTVTIKNGTIDASQITSDMKESLFSATGKLVLEDVTIKTSSTYSIKYLFSGYNNVTVKNSTINAQNVEFIAYGDNDSGSVKLTLDNTKTEVFSFEFVCTFGDSFFV